MKKSILVIIIASLELFLITSCGNKNDKVEDVTIITPPVQPGPKIMTDGSVTFQIIAPKATSVSISGDFTLVQNQVQELNKDKNGLWTLTVKPLPPGLYSYWFIMDGIPLPDPGNGKIKPGIQNTQSQFEIPGTGREWETMQNVPHGEVRMVWYNSSSLNTVRRMHIYFPPGYDNNTERYPVFYLFHGGGDIDNAWVYNGRVNMIMDNLLAKNEVKPMIIVMPCQFVLPKGSENFSENTGLFTKDLLEDIIPYTEKSYRTLTGSDNRALGGLSYSSILTDIAVSNLDKFKYLCITSSGLNDERIAYYDSIYVGVIDNPVNVKRTEIFIANGTNAMNYENSKNLIERMRQRGYNVTFFEHNGVHGWPEFREDFYDIIKLIFR